MKIKNSNKMTYKQSYYIFPGLTTNSMESVGWSNSHDFDPDNSKSSMRVQLWEFLSYTKSICKNYGIYDKT